MNKYKLSENQYKLIRNALEYYYDNCRSDSELSIKCDEIDKLEHSLIEQHKEHGADYQQMLDKIHDCYYDCMGEPIIQEQLEHIAVEIKKELQYEADQWGWDDTEIGDRIWNWINDNIKHG